MPGRSLYLPDPDGGITAMIAKFTIIHIYNPPVSVPEAPKSFPIIPP